MNSVQDHLAVGLPHSETHGSKLVRSSPWLIAAYYVLHRLLVPRHPPNALRRLISLVATRPRPAEAIRSRNLDIFSDPIQPRQLPRASASRAEPRSRTNLRHPLPGGTGGPPACLHAQLSIRHNDTALAWLSPETRIQLPGAVTRPAPRSSASVLQTFFTLSTIIAPAIAFCRWASSLASRAPGCPGLRTSPIR
jgi:hypothetical protein